MISEMHRDFLETTEFPESDPSLSFISYDQIMQMAKNVGSLPPVKGCYPHPRAFVVMQAQLSLPSCSIILAFLAAGIPLLVLAEHLSELRYQQVKRLLSGNPLMMWINGTASPYQIDGNGFPVYTVQEVFDSLQQAPDIPPSLTPPATHPTADPGLPSLVIATSGSTGEPKWVPFTYQQLSLAAKMSQAIMQPKPDHQWLLNLPLEHAGGLGILIRSFFWRSKVLITSDRSVDGILQILQTYPKVDTLSLVPTQMHRMLQHPKREVLASLKTILIGAGTLYQNDLTLARALNIPLRLSYGLTETFGHCCITPSLNHHPLKPFQCGAPLPGIHLQVEDEEGQPVPDSHSGYIRVKGKSVCTGYLNQTTSDLREEGFLTGDFGKLDDQGNLFFEARRTDIIKTGGKSVNVNRVQEAIDQTNLFSEVVVIGLEDPEWGQRVHVVGVTDKGDLPLAKLRVDLQPLLEPWELPRGLTLVAQIPRTPLGKTDVTALKEQLTINLRG